MRVRVILAVAVICAVALTSVLQKAPAAHTATTGIAVIACESLAGAIDGNTSDAITDSDVSQVCGPAGIGASGITNLAIAIGNQDGVLSLSDFATIDQDENQLRSNCTTGATTVAALNAGNACQLDVFVFTNSEATVTFDAPTGITFVPNDGTNDWTCDLNSEDADCNATPSGDGDGVVEAGVLASGAVPGDVKTIAVTQGNAQTADINVVGVAVDVTLTLFEASVETHPNSGSALACLSTTAITAAIAGPRTTLAGAAVVDGNGTLLTRVPVLFSSSNSNAAIATNAPGVIGNTGVSIKPASGPIGAYAAICSGTTSGMAMIDASIVLGGGPATDHSAADLAVGGASYVVTITGEGVGSLRNAITASNASAGSTDTITFTASGPIKPTSPLPAITDPVVIFGGTSGGVPNTELDGSLAGAGADGLVVSAAGSTVKGLAVVSFSGNGIKVASNANVVETTYAGLKLGGSTAAGNGANGVFVTGSNNRIGGPAASQRSAFSGNAGAGVQIDSGSSGNVVEGSVIGLDASTVLTPKPNNFGVIVTGSASGNQIGGASAGMGNVISGNTGQGIEMDCCGGNTVQGNLIGVDGSGTVAKPNSGYGIEAFAGGGNIIGGSSPGARNVISGNGAGGVYVFFSNGNVIQGNYIGVGSNGTTAIGNSGDGVFIDGSFGNGGGNTVGGTAAGTANVIANNSGYGVRADGASATGNAIRHNSIYGNTTSGIGLSGGANGSLAAPSITSTTPPTGTACAGCSVDVFTDTASQGRYYEGTAVANGSGNWSYYGPLTSTSVTATATNGSSNTSPFSTASAFTPCSGTYCLTGFWTLDFMGTFTNFCSISETQSGTSTIWGTFSCTTPAFGTFSGTFNQAPTPAAVATTSIISASGATFALSGTVAVNGLSASGSWTCTAVCTGATGTWTATRPNTGASNKLTLSAGVQQTYAGVTITTPAGSPAITATFLPTNPPFANGHPLRTEIRFEPSGLDLSSFSPPYVTVSADYGATPNDLPPAPDNDPCNLGFYELDETSNKWKFQSTVTACNFSLKTFTYHVSRFSFRSGAIGVDSDFDSCLDIKEILLVPPTDPNNEWDFYSVPVPALFAAPNPTIVFTDTVVSAGDAQAVFAYFKAGAKTGTTIYEQDLNVDNVKDGIEYDRTVVGPGQSGPADGVISAQDAQLAFAQFKKGYRC